MNLIFKNRRRQKKVKERQIGLQTNFKPISNRIAFRFAQNFLTLWKIAEGLEKRKKIQTGCTGNIYDPIKNGDLLAFGANGGWGGRGKWEENGGPPFGPLVGKKIFCLLFRVSGSKWIFFGIIIQNLICRFSLKIFKKSKVRTWKIFPGHKFSDFYFPL